MNRTPADYGHIVLGEIDGRELRGTVEKIIAEARGDKPATGTDELGTATVLLKLAEVVSAPAAFKQRLTEIQKATEAARAETVASGRERAAVDKLRADVQAEYRKHQEQMAAELKQHQAALATVNAEVEAAKKLAANLIAKTKTDADAAAKIRADLQRRLKLITEAA
jgi:hypothetical protein